MSREEIIESLKLTPEELEQQILAYYIELCQSNPPKMPNYTELVRCVADFAVETAQKRTYENGQKKVALLAESQALRLQHGRKEYNEGMQHLKYDENWKKCLEVKGETTRGEE